MCDEVASVQEQIHAYHKQRKFLLARVLKRNSDLKIQFNIWHKLKYGEKETTLINGDDISDGKSDAIPHKRKYIKRCYSETTGSKNKSKKHKPLFTNGTVQYNTGIHLPLVFTRTLDIPLNLFGQPIFPFSVNGFTVYSLGKIMCKSGYHTETYIYPVGYKISRIYGHFKDAEKKCVYTCRVIENGEFPKFEIFASDGDPTDPKVFRVTGPSPDYCHTSLLQYINSICVRSIDIRPQGEKFFGLDDHAIMSLIRKMPNYEKCPLRGLRDSESNNISSDATLDYDALQRHINLSVYHTVPEIKEEPPEDLFDN